MGLKDGLSSLELNVTTVSGTTSLATTVSGTTVGGATLQGATLTAGAGEVGNAELASNACSGTKVSMEYPVAKTGSPGVGNIAFQYGTDTLSAGSVKWVVFGTPFAATPRVLVSNTKTVSKVVSVVAGSTNAGSFFAEGEAASDTFDWIALGSGRI